MRVEMHRANVFGGDPRWTGVLCVLRAAKFDFSELINRIPSQIRFQDLRALRVLRSHLSKAS